MTQEPIIKIIASLLLFFSFALLIKHFITWFTLLRYTPHLASFWRYLNPLSSWQYAEPYQPKRHIFLQSFTFIIVFVFFSVVCYLVYFDLLNFFSEFFFKKYRFTVHLGLSSALLVLSLLTPFIIIGTAYCYYLFELGIKSFHAAVFRQFQVAKAITTLMGFLEILLWSVWIVRLRFFPPFFL